MSHVLIVNIPAYGHIGPTLEVVRELLRRGHRVSYAITANYADTVAGTGAEVVVYESELEPMLAGQDDYREELVGWWQFALTRAALELFPVLRERFAEDPPDLVVHDVCLAACGRMLGLALDRPVLQSCPSLASSPHYSHMGAINEAKRVTPEHPGQVALWELAEEFLRAHDLPADRKSWLVDWLAEDELVFLPKAFQPHGETFDDRHVFAGLCTADLDQPDSGLEFAAGDGPLVLMSPGTLAVKAAKAYQDCVDAVTGTPWRLALVFGNREPVLDVNSLPPNVSAHGWIPQLAALAHASAFITQGGMGSLMQALSQGVPPIVITEHPDAVVVGRRITELGLGALLSPEEATPERIRATIAGLLADPGIGDRLAWMREEIAGAGGVGAAVAAIEARCAG